jgi:hypothetical protein
MTNEMMTCKTAAVAYLFDWMNWRRNNSARIPDAQGSKIEISQIQLSFSTWLSFPSPLTESKFYVRSCEEYKIRPVVKMASRFPQPIIIIFTVILW